MRPLSEWSMPRVVTTAWGWVVVALVIAFLPPFALLIAWWRAQKGRE